MKHSKEIELVNRLSKKVQVQPMIEIVRLFSQKIAQDICTLAGSQGVEIKKADGDAIKKAFEQAGYQPYEQIKKFFVIESSLEEIGITIDYREGKCVIGFFMDE